MINRVGKSIAAFEADPTTELDVKGLLQLKLSLKGFLQLKLSLKGLLQLKLSLDKKLITLEKLDGEILELVEDEAVEEETERADAYKESVYAATVNIHKHCTRVNVAVSRSPEANRASPTSDKGLADSTTRVRLPKLPFAPLMVT